MRTEKLAVYLTIVWMIINIALFTLMLLNGDVEDFNNWIEIALWVISIAGLLSAKKWGLAFTVFTLAYTLSTSVGIVIYVQGLSFDAVLWVNAVRVLINAILIVYFFKQLLDYRSK
jgi:hypothetical protein